MTKAKTLRFVLEISGLTSGNMKELHDRMPPCFLLNRTEWMGKEPRSCAITHVSTRPHSMGDNSPIICDIEVTYRPKGYISYVGRTRYDGWTAMPLDRRPDGTLLDGNGQPLKDGENPVNLPVEVKQDVEFNDFNLGQFVDETEIPPIPHTTVEAVMKELENSHKAFSFSTESKFVAPHRQRPLTKIILSNAPTCQGTDGFGGCYKIINLSTPHLEFVLMEQLAALMRDFLEGKVSITNSGNEDFIFVELSSSLMDCSPNESGFDTWFNMLQSYTPVGFLEDLAKLLMAEYEVEISVIDSKDGGLVIRREQKKS